MDIKELDKKQLVLLTLLITFVVSIATGIVTVSLMNQAPKSVPQTINNVIQRTIEKVSTVENISKNENNTTAESNSSGVFLGGGDTLVSIYQINQSSGEPSSVTTVNTEEIVDSTNKELGQGVIISDVGLILVDSSVLNESITYRVVLDKTDFDASVLKKFNNGFTILKISEKQTEVKNSTEIKNDSTNTPTN